MEVKFMREALELARTARDMDEVPVGAVVVLGGEIIGRGHNLREASGDCTSHAEITAIRQACAHVRGWRLIDCDIYVTLEPCPMCAGAIIMARISNLYFGAYDPKAGCCSTLYNLPEDERFNHRAAVTGGILRDDCAGLLSDFFSKKRYLSSTL